jgi:hypothetical protein
VSSEIWMPLPFPTCPSCYNSWVICYHRNCYVNGEIVAEPYLRLAKCEGCSSQWDIMQTTFYCSCGHIFQASEVEKALSTATLLRSRLIQHIQSIDQAEDYISRTTNKSFSQWLDKLSYELGKLVGKTAAQLRKWIQSLF